MQYLVVFTNESVNDIKSIGGSGWWKVNAEKVAELAERGGRVVLCHNSRGKPSAEYRVKRVSNPIEHGKPFLVATVAGLRNDDHDGRKLIQFDEWAEVIESKYEWPGVRVPTIYAENVPVAPGQWHKMDPVPFDLAKSLRDAFPDEKLPDTKDEPKPDNYGNFFPKAGAPSATVCWEAFDRLYLVLKRAPTGQEALDALPDQKPNQAKTELGSWKKYRNII